MTTSGTTAFNPSLGELGLFAFGMVRVRPSGITQDHMFNLRMAANLMLSTWSNKQVNLWKVDLVEVPLIDGTATYDVDASTIMMLDAYIETQDGSANPLDRLIFPISRTEYASYPDKSLEAAPTVFWFDRLLQPTLTLWPVPDATGTYTLKYYRVTQVQDAMLTNAQTVDIPYRWMEAFVHGLAARLAPLYAQDLAQAYKGTADELWMIAAAQDTENVPLFIAPGISGYSVR